MSNSSRTQLRIALAQITSGPDLDANAALVEEWTGKAADAAADVVVFPEATMRAFGYPLIDIAEPLDGPWAQRVRQVAAEAGITVIVGMFTPGEDSAHVKNTVLVTGPGVEEHYDKLHMYDAFGFAESDTVSAGDRVVTVDVGDVRLGLAICYDVRFPSLFTALARKGAHAVVLPTSWQVGEGKVDAWRTVVNARALDATTYVLACGQALPSAAGVESKDKAPTGIGHSLAVSPSGRIIAEAGEAPELVVVDVEPEKVEKARKALPVLANARDISALV